MTRLIGWIPLGAVALMACAAEGDAGGVFSGSVRDSAGISIIENGSTGIWAPGEEWTVETELVIGTAEGEAHLQFGQISGVAIDADGGIHVLDFQAAQVQSFDAAGEYVRTVSRRGGGPGEIRFGAGLFAGPANDLVVTDLGSRRVTSFPLDGSEPTSFPFNLTSAQPVRFEMTSTGTIVGQIRTFSGGAGQPIVLGDDNPIVTFPREEPRDTLARLRAGETVSLQSDLPVLRIFAAEPMWTLDGNDGVLTARNDETFITQYVDGEVARIIHRDVTAQPVSDSDARLILGIAEEQIRENAAANPAMAQRIIDAMTIADYFPTLLQLTSGPENTIWVQRLTQFNEMTEEERESFNPLDLGSRWWEVYDADGRYLGDVQTEDNFQPIGIDGDLMYGIWRDDLDVQYAMTARIIMP